MTISTDGINNITEADVERINRIRHKNGHSHLPRHEMIRQTKEHPAYTDSFDWLEFLTTVEVADAMFHPANEVPHADVTDPTPIQIGEGKFGGAGTSASFDPEPAQAPQEDPVTGLSNAAAPVAPEPAPAPQEAPVEAPSYDPGPADGSVSGDAGSVDSGVSAP